MVSRLSVERHDIAALWSTVARLRAANGDRAGADMAKWQAKQFRARRPTPYVRQRTHYWSTTTGEWIPRR